MWGADTLACFPLKHEDPFIMEQCPHIFFAGNQPEYGATTMAGDDKQQVPACPASADAPRALAPHAAPYTTHMSHGRLAAGAWPWRQAPSCPHPLVEGESRGTAPGARVRALAETLTGAGARGRCLWCRCRLSRRPTRPCSSTCARSRPGPSTSPARPSTRAALYMIVLSSAEEDRSGRTSAPRGHALAPPIRPSVARPGARSLCEPRPGPYRWLSLAHFFLRLPHFGFGSKSRISNQLCSLSPILIYLLPPALFGCCFHMLHMRPLPRSLIERSPPPYLDQACHAHS
jgi:hypothetical protein